MSVAQLATSLYLVDTFAIYAASALAAFTVARSLGGALIPLGGHSLYAELGLGWGNSVLALISLATWIICGALFICGSKLHSMSSTSQTLQGNQA